jgi:hypothetical protein
MISSDPAFTARQQLGGRLYLINSEELRRIWPGR